MVYAKTSRAAAELTRQIAKKTFKKEYVAIIEGKPQNDEDSLIDLLYHDKQKNKTFVVTRERRGVKKAELSYKLLKYSIDDNTSRVSIDLKTGRTHQIRVQFSSRKNPVAGDKKYGSSVDLKPIRLHCSSISFSLPTSKKLVTFNSNPEW